MYAFVCLATFLQLFCAFAMTLYKIVMLLFSLIEWVDSSFIEFKIWTVNDGIVISHRVTRCCCWSLTFSSFLPPMTNLYECFLPLLKARTEKNGLWIAVVGIAGVVCVSVVYSVNEVNEKTGCVLLGVRGETGICFILWYCIRRFITIE